MEIELPETSGRDRFEQTVTVLIGVGAVMAALLVNLDLSSHRHEARAAAEGSRLAVAAFRTMTTGSLDISAKTNALVRVTNLVVDSQLKELAAKSDLQMSIIAKADRMAGDRAAAAYLSTVGFRGPATQLLQGSNPMKSQLAAAAHQDAQSFALDVSRSNVQVDRADLYGRRASRATLALAFLASAGALFGLAGVLRVGRAGWLSLATGVVGLLGAAAVGISALAL
jgi:hypothetical protein